MEIIGTTRSRVNFLMNKFRKLGFIDYNGKLRLHTSFPRAGRRRNQLQSKQNRPLVAAAANAPVFGLFDVYLIHGEVGRKRIVPARPDEDRQSL